MKMLMRSIKIQKKYHNYKTYLWDGSNPFNDNDLLICELKHWKVVLNQFPYDRVLSEHYILVPILGVDRFEKLSQEAKDEFFMIKNDELLKQYGIEFDFFVVNDIRDMSVPFIFHAHIGKRKWWFFPIIDKMFF